MADPDGVADAEGEVDGDGVADADGVEDRVGITDRDGVADTDGVVDGDCEGDGDGVLVGRTLIGQQRVPEVMAIAALESPVALTAPVTSARAAIGKKEHDSRTQLEGHGPKINSEHWQGQRSVEKTGARACVLATEKRCTEHMHSSTARRRLECISGRWRLWMREERRNRIFTRCIYVGGR